MKAVILGAGYGSRLRPLTNEKPKPLVEIKGKPILEWQINWLKKHGIKEIVITTGYKREMIMEWGKTNLRKK
ncbi:NDP-sugar synthase [Metallosphaera sp.]|uniref:nucleotidyltransferase family protein n=1 Tax=Metallosphaera sp. TaxID=2020860 RepID=UPI003862085B